MKDFANNNLKFDENLGKFSKRVENTGGKVEIAGDKLLIEAILWRKGSALASMVW